MSTHTLITGDSDWANVELSLQFEGEHNDTTLVDRAGKTVTAGNGAFLTKLRRNTYGETSGFTDGSDDYFSVGSASDWTFMHDATEWSLEGWFGVDSFATEATLFATSNGSSVNHGVYCAVKTGREFTFQMYRGTSGVLTISYTSAANAWPNDGLLHHLRITYDEVAAGADIVSIYIDNTLLAAPTTINSNSASAPTTTLNFGRIGSGALFRKGLTQDVRITKNVLRGSGLPTTFYPGQYKARHAGTITESLAPVAWTVRVSRVDTGVVVGEQITSSGSYSIDVDYIGAVFIDFYPDIGDKWQAGVVVATGKRVFATNTVSTPHFWECTTGGTTGGTEPTWNLSGTTTDNSVTWTYVGELVQPIRHGPLVPA